MGFAKEGLKSLDFGLVLNHLLVCLVLVDREVQTEFLEDLHGSLRLQGFQSRSDFAGAATENLELFAFNQVLEVRHLLDKGFEEDSASFYEFSVVVVLHLEVLSVNDERNLLGNGRDVAPGPSLDHLLGQGFKFVEASLARPLSLRVATSDGVLRDLPHFDGVPHGEGRGDLLDLVLDVLQGALHLLAL